MLGLVVVSYSEYDYLGGKEEQGGSTPVVSAALCLGSVQLSVKLEYWE